MKKLLSILLVLVFCFGVFVSCNGETQTESSSDGSQDSEIAENAKKQLISYFTDKRDELDGNLAKAESIAAQDEEKKQEIKMAIDEISAILRDISEGIA